MSEINHPDYKYSLNIANLRIEMQRFVYSIEAVKRCIASTEAELIAIQGDAEFEALNPNELEGFNQELKRYEASKQSLQDLINYEAPEQCHFDNCDAIASETYKGHNVCNVCYDDLMSEELDS